MCEVKERQRDVQHREWVLLSSRRERVVDVGDVAMSTRKDLCSMERMMLKWNWRGTMGQERRERGA